jgi:RHS repeat-associated protein
MRHQRPLQFLWLICIFLAAGTSSGYSQALWNPGFSVGTITGNYAFSYNQTPDQLVALSAAGIPSSGLTYSWESSTTPVPANFQPTGITTTSYSFSAPLTQTMYYRLKASQPSGQSMYSNVITLNLVSINWEDNNYIREHTVDTEGINTWQAADQLPIGEKFVATRYMDGLGRPIQVVSKQTATPAGSGGSWGDAVQFFEYDVFGREPLKYLAYTTTNQAGKFKTSPITDQANYYSTVYSESSPYNNLTFDNSPLNRVMNLKASGHSWAASSGNTVTYDVNTAADSVQMWSLDYTQGDAPLDGGAYPAGTLHKQTSTDVNGNQVVDYIDIDNELILRKVQAIATPAAGHTGWACTYIVYDELGRVRYQIQPLGVQYLNSNSWSFGGTNGPIVLAEQCYQYNYDDKGRNIWKKTPGIAPLSTVYDIRDRAVFMQDGNQATPPALQWTTMLYDGLDRPVASVLFNTTETLASLQADVANATTTSSVTVSTAANTGGVSVTLNLSLCPVSINSTSLNSGTSTEVLKYIFYDTYTFPGAAAFNTSYTNLTAYNTSNPDVIPIAASQRVWDRATGSMVRVLGSTSMFLENTNYYDEKGRHIQSSEGNIRNGMDVTTLQYHWDGRKLSSCNSHSNSTGGYSAYITLTKYNFDNIGRVDSIQKQYGSNAMKTVSSYQYDDMGRLGARNFDPAYANVNSGASGLESLGYSYNIHSQITGINKDYANKISSDYNKWGHFFGEYLGYDNSTNSFANAQLDGQVTGKIWNTQGDDVQRRYDFTYDNANRLVNAQYQETQTANSGWNHTQMNFKVVGHTGQVTYDLNGNLLTMQQTGVIPGLTAPIVIDDLFYGYNAFSNKLAGVSDGMTSTTYNGLSGDFAPGPNGSLNYSFDNNGDEVIDPNKNIQSLNNGAPGTNGAHYNYLNKPDQINLVGQGAIDIVYSADGETLQRTFIPSATGTLSTVTTYIGDYVYQSRGALALTAAIPYTTGTADTLDYINFEEGRVRVMTPITVPGYDNRTESGNLTLPQTTLAGVWDYFVRDYQENVRMVLTEEYHLAVNRCTMETDRASAEDPVFGQSGSANEVEATRQPVPPGWQAANTSGSCSELGNIFGHNVGPNTLQKVMAGDLINTSVFYYFQAVSGNTNSNVVSNILTCLVGAMGGTATAGSLVGENVSSIATNLGNNTSFLSLLDPSSPPPNTPQAYLTVLFFDERFNPVPASDGGVYQAQVASTWVANANLGFNGIKVPKNGYVYIYVSNLSDQSVYFDNMAVAVTAGNIAEENHYYPFGLKIASICSRRLGDANEGTIKNNYLYNDKELFDDGRLNWYDYGFRNYDPQIGRFAQMDPITDYIPSVSPYQYAFNDPVTNIDKDGLIGGIPCPLPPGSSVGFLGDLVNSLTTVLNALSPALSYVTMAANVSITTAKVVMAVKNSGDINGEITTRVVGEQSESKPDDEIYVNTKTKQVTVLKSDDDFDNVHIDGAKPTKVEKGKTVQDYKNQGYSIKKGPEGVGDGAFWGACIWLAGAKRGKWAFGVVGGWLAESAAKEGINMALGVTEHLDEFAESVNGTTWETWGAKDFETQFISEINNPANKISFNLTGPDGTMINAWKAVSEGAKGVASSRATSWELFQLYSNPGALSRTTFYFNGKIIPSPF